MKKTLVLFLLISMNFLNAQIHEVGVFLGGSNFIGDVGKTNYVSPNELAFGVLYKWNKSPRHSFRFSYMQSSISGNDLDSEVPGRKLRGFSFKNDVKEVSVGIEFDFFDFNLHDGKKKLTPYVCLGVSYFAYDELFVVNGQTKKDFVSSSFGIPIIVGVKTNFADHWILGAEVGVRYNYNDNLDGSNPSNKNLQLLKFGNVNSNDWYVFSGLTMTYTFGNKPCYCAD